MTLPNKILVDYIVTRRDQIIYSELKAFPGITRAMLNVRLISRDKKINYGNRVDQLIEDGEIVIRFKHVEGVKNPTQVLFLKNDVDSIVSSPMMGIENELE